MKHKSFKMLQLLDNKAVNSAISLKFCKNLKKHITLLTYLLPCLAARSFWGQNIFESDHPDALFLQKSWRLFFKWRPLF